MKKWYWRNALTDLNLDRFKFIKLPLCTMFVRCGFYATFKCQLTHNHHRYSDLPKQNDTPLLHFIFRQFIKCDGVKYVIKMTEHYFVFFIFIFWQRLFESISENKYETNTFSDNLFAKLFSMFFLWKRR